MTAAPSPKVRRVVALTEAEWAAVGAAAQAEGRSGAGQLRQLVREGLARRAREAGQASQGVQEQSS